MTTALRELFNGFQQKTPAEMMAIAEELDRLDALVGDLKLFTRNTIHDLKMADPLAILDGIFSKHSNELETK